MLLPALELNVIAGLVCMPSVDDVTQTLTVQLLFAPRAPPVKVIVVPPSGAEIRPLGQAVVDAPVPPAPRRPAEHP